jgi:MFS family permease
MLAAIIAGLLGRFVSYEAIFYFSIVQCIALVIAVCVIREKDIDHELARGADKDDDTTDNTGVRALLTNKNILLFTIAVALFHLANAAMLPLVGQKMGLADKQNSSLYLSAAIIIAQGVMVFVASYSGKASENGRKKVLMIAFLLLPVRAILFAFIDNPYWLTAIQLIDGIGAGIFGVVSIIMIADLSKGTGRFNLLQGVVYSAIGLGAALSSLIAGILVEQFGYVVGFASLAGIGALASFFFISFVPETIVMNEGNTGAEAPIDNQDAKVPL